MTTFNIHDEDGRITQSNKVYDPKGYHERLHEIGHKFVATSHAGPLSNERHFVRGGSVQQRPALPIKVDRTQIKAGGNDAAKITGVPAGAKIDLYTGGMHLGTQQADGKVCELPIPVPCVYRVVIEKWPYRPWVCDVTAS